MQQQKVKTKEGLKSLLARAVNEPLEVIVTKQNDTSDPDLICRFDWEVKEEKKLP